jgi:hypothetical protein
MAKAKKKGVGKVSTFAIHGKDNDGTHVVGIGNLRVVISTEDGIWFAQGLEIDYAAQGNSLADAKKQFEDGLRQTIEEHLRVYGNIEKILTVAPKEIWKEMLFNDSCLRKRYSQVSVHEGLHASLPFENIQYLETSDAA